MSDRILIAGCIGFGNTGDEAIAKAVTDDLRQLIPGAEITIISGNPAHTAEAYGVRAIDWHAPLPITEAVRNTDLTIVGGGGLFQDYWGFDPNAVLTREYWGLSYYVTPALLSAVYGKPLMLYAVGVGPLLTDLGRKFTKVAGDIATRITVRDPGSKNLFESLGVDGDKIAVTADPAFNITPVTAADIPEVCEWASNRPAIAVCLRNWTFGKDPMNQTVTGVEAEQSFCERQIAAALDDLLANEGGRVLFVPFHLVSGFHDDLVVANRVIALLRHRQNAAVLTRPCSPAMLAGILAKADLVLGMRLHSVIFSLASKVPFVALEYDPKIGGLTALTGLEQFTLPYGGIEADVLAGRMRQALSERESFQELAGTLGNDLGRRAKENAVIAAELLQQGSSMTDYGSDARSLIGGLVMTQVAGNECLVERLRASGEELDQPVAEIPPIEILDRLDGAIRDLRTELQAQTRETEGIRAQLEGSRHEVDGLGRELQDARHEVDGLGRELQDARLAADTAQMRLEIESYKASQLSLDLQLAHTAKQRSDSQVTALTSSVQGLQKQVARLESKTPAGIAKRALQLALDALQLLTPAPLRAAVRKYYLNWFYFRIYPERRVGAEVHSAQDN